MIRYRDYVRDQLWIDAVFKKHDADGSGELEEGELLPLLQARSRIGRGSTTRSLHTA